MDILNWLMENVLSIMIAAGGAIAWLSERRKRKADIASVEVVTAQGNADVFQKMRNSYNEFVLDLNTRLNELRSENEELKKEIAELRKRLSGAETERVELTNKVHDLETQNAELRQELEKYQKELKLYRKESKK